MGFVCFGLLLALLIAGCVCAGYRKTLIRRLDKKEHPVKCFYPLAAKLTDRFRKHGKTQKRVKTEGLLKSLYVKENVEEELYVYQIRKTALILTVFCATLLFASILSVVQTGREALTSLERNAPGGGVQNYELQVEYEGREEELDLPVEEEKLSREEILKKMDESLDAVVKEMLGENERTDAVSRPLSFPSRFGSFQVLWEIGDSGLIGYNGEIRAQLKKEETKLVNLTATLSKEEIRKTYSIPVVLNAPEESEKEALEKEIKTKVEESNDAYKKEVQLPASLNGKSVTFRKKNAQDPKALLLLSFLAVIAVFFFYDRGLEEKLKKRKEEMMTDFPEIVSKLNLLYEAGSSIRMAFERIVADQEKKKELPYAYREMKLALEKIRSGVSEREAYAQFGKRCGLHSFVKLGNLLEQNLSKGTKGMKVLLSQEVADAFEERKRLARKKEGTKMLIPMILMMVVVVVIVALPALMSIQL